MNVLILNHHFNQDIHELEYFNSNMHTIKLISPNYFANQAKRLFPKEVFGADLKLFFKEQYNSNRRKYREIAFKLIYDIYKIYQFDRKLVERMRANQMIQCLTEFTLYTLLKTFSLFGQNKKCC